MKDRNNPLFRVSEKHVSEERTGMDQQTAKSIASIVKIGKDSARKELWWTAKLFFVLHAFLTSLMAQGVIIATAIGLNVPKPLALIALLYLVNLFLSMWYAAFFSESKNANPTQN